MPAKDYKWKVADGCSVLDDKAGATGTLLRPGTILNNDHFDEQWLVDQAKNNIIKPVVKVEQIADRDEPPPVSQPGVVPPIPVGGSSDGDGSKVSSEPARINTGAGGPTITSGTTPPAGAEPVQQEGSIWNLDPAGLQSKTLEQLNVMVGERDAQAQPFETTAEAIAWLSRDFKAPQTATPPQSRAPGGRPNQRR
jgi:hypothetical protein